MASIGRNLTKACSKWRVYGSCQPNYVFKRYLRVDPEEEMERLFITKSFQQRMSELALSKPKPVVLGRPPQSGFESDDSKLSQLTRTRKSVDENLHQKPSEFWGYLPSEEVIVCSSVERNLNAFIRLMSHYKVFEHLFRDNVVFYPDPSINFKVAFPLADEYLAMVFSGNRLLPSDTCEEPLVRFTGKEDKRYSVFLVNLDGHMEKDDGEYIHWYSGEVMLKYFFLHCLQILSCFHVECLAHAGNLLVIN